MYGKVGDSPAPRLTVVKNVVPCLKVLLPRLSAHPVGQTPGQKHELPSRFQHGMQGTGEIQAVSAWVMTKEAQSLSKECKVAGCREWHCWLKMS